jgi:hypothetical protein
LETVAVAETKKDLLTIMTSIKKKQWSVAGAVIVCLILSLFYPFESTVVPKWKLRVIDQTGRPLSGNRIRESWCHYTLETNCHEEELQTDSLGYVEFPRRTIRMNLFSRVANAARRIINVHSSFGPSASVYYLGDYRLVSDEPWYMPGRPLESEIVVLRP